MSRCQKFLTRIGSGWVRHLWFVFEFRKFPLKHQFFQFFGGQKVSASKAGWPLIYCGSKVSSGQVRSEPISTLQKTKDVQHGEKDW